MELDDKDTHTMRSAESSRAKMWSLLIKAGGIRISRIGLTVLDAITTEGALYEDKAKNQYNKPQKTCYIESTQERLLLVTRENTDSRLCKSSKANYT